MTSPASKSETEPRRVFRAYGSGKLHFENTCTPSDGMGCKAIPTCTHVEEPEAQRFRESQQGKEGGE